MMTYLSALLTESVLYPFMFMCFVAAATLMAVGYHQRMQVLEKQNNEILALLRRMAGVPQEKD